jgi:aminoglycoside phosphotransferase (APT) family kinase protein
MLEEQPGFWRIGVVEAVAMFDDPPVARSAALRDPRFRVCFERWRQEASNVVGFPFRPIHPDPHWNNYVVADGLPYLLDWENIDLSDPMRDIGIQIWGFLPKHRWQEFLRRVGLNPTKDVETAMYWWAAFKVLMNAFWIDAHGDESGARFHAHLFCTAVERRPWVAEHD